MALLLETPVHKWEHLPSVCICNTPPSSCKQKSKNNSPHALHELVGSSLLATVLLPASGGSEKPLACAIGCCTTDFRRLDSCVLDLQALEWYRPERNIASLPQIRPVAVEFRVVGLGHKVMAVDLSVGSVLVYDADWGSWTAFPFTGEFPSARAYYSLAVSGNKLVLFGGVDTSGSLLCDCYILETGYMSWRRVQCILKFETIYDCSSCRRCSFSSVRARVCYYLRNSVYFW